MGVEAKLFQLDTPEISDKLLGKNLRIQTQNVTSVHVLLLNESVCVVLRVQALWIQMPAKIKKEEILSGT